MGLTNRYEYNAFRYSSPLPHSPEELECFNIISRTDPFTENQLTAMATDSSYTPTNSRWKTEFTYDGRVYREGVGPKH